MFTDIVVETEFNYIDQDFGLSVILGIKWPFSDCDIWVGNLFEALLKNKRKIVLELYSNEIIL